METQVRVYAYRWVVLAAFMAVNLTIQLLWISYAPVTTTASRYFGVGAVEVGALAMVFMVVYIPLSIPASYLIDRRGLRVASGFGARCWPGWPAWPAGWRETGTARCSPPRWRRRWRSRSCSTPGPRCRCAGSRAGSGRRRWAW